jgi:chemotaxis protein CheD
MLKARQDEQNPTDRIVGPGDCDFSPDAAARLITFGLESCIAIAVYAPAISQGALLRFSFPLSGTNPALAKKRPWLFADTAIPEFLSQIRRQGVRNHEMSVHAVGAADVPPRAPFFASGKSNYLMMKKILWREGVLLRGEDVGGKRLRSLWLDAGTGRIIVRIEAAGFPTSPIDSTGVDLWRSAS